MNRLNLIAFVCLLLSSSCREPFEPDIKVSDQKVLVVEGYLDTEGIPSTLKLSYTRNIQDSQIGAFQNPYLSNAFVYLRSDSGKEYPLTVMGNGMYEFAYDIPEEQTYTLHILADDGVSYSSEPLQPIFTPDILDIGFEKNQSGVEIYVSTKGDENADDFLWTFEETYAFRAAVASTYRYDPEEEKMFMRTPEEKIDLCYRGGLSSDLILETSSKFQDQVVFRKSITQIPTGDERLSVNYSILVSQKALDKKATEFWEILRKNTDDLGSIFSPMPSTIRGNITNDLDPSAPVVGYVSLGTVKQKRMFIGLREVIPWKTNVPDYYGCFVEPDTIPPARYDAVFRSQNTLPATPIFSDNGIEPIAFQGAKKACADCTLRGTNVKPEFWID